MKHSEQLEQLARDFKKEGLSDVQVLTVLVKFGDAIKNYSEEVKVIVPHSNCQVYEKDSVMKRLIGMQSDECTCGAKIINQKVAEREKNYWL